MAYALVGSAGAIANAASGAAASPAWGAGESRTAGNLLICWYATNSGTAAAPPTGWTKLPNTVSNLIYWKVATGGDAAPSFVGLSGVVQIAMLAEFSGNDQVAPADQNGSGNTLGTSPVVVANFGVDAGPGELYVESFGIIYSASATKTFTPTMNNGMTPHATSTAAVSQAVHAYFNWAITTSNTVADQDSLAVTTTKLSSAQGASMSFIPASGAPVATARPTQRVVAQAVQRAATRCWTRRRSGIVVPRLWTPEPGLLGAVM